MSRSAEGAPLAVRRRIAIMRALAVALLLALALLAAGVPPRLLAPTGWAAFARDVHGSLGNVATTLWPYTGESAWTRLDILLGLAVVAVAAAVVGFWPARWRAADGGSGRSLSRLCALVLLVALYVA